MALGVARGDSRLRLWLPKGLQRTRINIRLEVRTHGVRRQDGDEVGGGRVCVGGKVMLKKTPMQSLHTVNNCNNVIPWNPIVYFNSKSLTIN